MLSKGAAARVAHTSPVFQIPCPAGSVACTIVEHQGLTATADSPTIWYSGHCSLSGLEVPPPPCARNHAHTLERTRAHIHLSAGHFSPLPLSPLPLRPLPRRPRSALSSCRRRVPSSRSRRRTRSTITASYTKRLLRNVRLPRPPGPRPSPSSLTPSPIPLPPFPRSALARPVPVCARRSKCVESLRRTAARHAGRTRLLAAATDTHQLAQTADKSARTVACVRACVRACACARSERCTGPPPPPPQV
jgi:hypothetical protein